MSLFVDTSALYAVLDRDDSNHTRARATWKKALSGSERLTTTNYVLVETAALVQNRLGMEAVRVFFDDIVPVLEIEWVGPTEHQAASHALLAAGRRQLSLVDCCSFQVMRRLGLRSVFAFDRHFSEQGFSTTR